MNQQPYFSFPDFSTEEYWKLYEPDEITLTEKDLLRLIQQSEYDLRPRIDLYILYKENSLEDKAKGELRKMGSLVKKISGYDFPNEWPADLLYGILGNKPLIRFLYILGANYWEEGNTEMAKQVFENLLVRDSNDGFGFRFLLLKLYKGEKYRNVISNKKDLEFMIDQKEYLAESNEYPLLFLFNRYLDENL